MKAENFDNAFDSGQDVAAHLDLLNARRPNQEQRRLNMEMPLWMIQSLDKEASRLGVPRQSLIKVVIAQHLDRQRA